MRNYFKAYSTALRSKWYKSVVKWIYKTGPKRVLFSLLLSISAMGIYLYDYIFNAPILIIDPNWTWKDDLKMYLDYAALGIIGLNGLAWAVSEFKYNVIFLTQLVLVVIYLAVYYADLLFNAALIPYALVLTSAIILILPQEAKQRFRRSGGGSSSRSGRSSRSRSRSKEKTATTAASTEATIIEP